MSGGLVKERQKEKKKKTQIKTKPQRPWKALTIKQKTVSIRNDILRVTTKSFTSLIH